MQTKRLLIVLFFSFFTVLAFAGKKSVTFNVMVADKAKKDVMKKIKKQTGVYSVKSNDKMGAVVVEYDDAETSVNTLTTAFQTAGVYASPVGENCATKPGGCLNNKPTTTNTMR